RRTMNGLMDGRAEAFAVWSYLAYLFASVTVTIWVARTLHRNGRVFLVDAFLGNEALADSVNHLLVVGFYLINIGYVALALREPRPPPALQASMEFFSSKIGWVLMVLGMMHFFNMWVFTRMRRRAQLSQEPPPVAPDGMLPAGR